jgi:hypothetical protein
MYSAILHDEAFETTQRLITQLNERAQKELAEEEKKKKRRLAAGGAAMNQSNQAQSVQRGVSKNASSLVVKEAGGRTSQQEGLADPHLDMDSEIGSSEEGKNQKDEESDDENVPVSAAL